MNLCILTNRTLTGSPAVPAPVPLIINNILMPLRVVYNLPILPSSLFGIQEILDSLQETEVICIYQFPSVLTQNRAQFPSITVNGDTAAGSATIQINGDTITVDQLKNYVVQFGDDTHVYVVVSNTANTLTIQPALIDPITNNTVIKKFSDAPVPSAVSTKTITMNTTIDGYTPRNKKLFSSPYNKLVVSNNCGQIAEYSWENLSTSGTPRSTEFKITGSIISTPSVLCYPSEYRGKTDDYDSGILYADFPQCCWSGDTFKAWWAQNKASFWMGIAGSLIGGAGNASASKLQSNVYANLSSKSAQRTDTLSKTLLDNRAAAASAAKGYDAAFGSRVVGGVMVAKQVIDTAITIGNAVAPLIDIKNTPSQTYGQVQSDSLNPALKKVQFTFYKMSIKAQYARIIDDYFDRFGYATKRNKIPNRDVRQTWTYTKTIGCTAIGSVPADDMSTICSIYDKGITFWHSDKTVGDYTQQNAPYAVGP